jgi:uncharacterized damage-inducible protein DinB
MSDRLEVAMVLLLVNLSGLVAAAAAWIQSLRNARQIDSVQARFDGRVDQLVAQAREAGAAEARARCQQCQSPPPPTSP